MGIHLSLDENENIRATYQSMSRGNFHILKVGRDGVVRTWMMLNGRCAMQRSFPRGWHDMVDLGSRCWRKRAH